MAAHHHHHHHLPNPPNPCFTSSFGYGCTFNANPNCDCNQAQHCHSPPLESVDPILLYSQTRCFQRPNPRKLHRQEPQQRETSLLILSLVSRIEALEASLARFPPNRSGGDRHYRYRSLQDIAARVIQTHFRAFLVSRSRTLGELKDLAVIKSASSSLMASVSGAIGFDFYAVSRKAADLLVRLDSIQGADPMVRDGKKSISRDLVRFLEFVEDRAKKHELALRSRKNARFCHSGEKARVSVVKSKHSDLNGAQREMIGKLRERVERIRGYTRVSRNDDEDVVLEGFQHVSDDDEEQEKGNSVRNGVMANKKRVSFAENRNMLKLFSDTDEIQDGSDCLDGDSTTSSDEQSPEVEEFKVLSLGTEDNGDEEEHVVNKASSHRLESDLRREGSFQGSDSDEFLFSAPLPVYMEEKSDLPKRRNEVKILR